MNNRVQYSPGYHSAHKQENPIISGAIFIISMLCIVYGMSFIGVLLGGIQ